MPMPASTRPSTRLLSGLSPGGEHLARRNLCLAVQLLLTWSSGPSSLQQPTTGTVDSASAHGLWNSSQKANELMVLNSRCIFFMDAFGNSFSSQTDTKRILFLFFSRVTGLFQLSGVLLFICLCSAICGSRTQYNITGEECLSGFREDVFFFHR
jgi:hypothetical protein